MANHFSHAALPYPVKKARFTVVVPYLDADGDPTDPTTPDTEVSKDAGAFADCSEEVSTISGSNGSGYLTLTGDELNCTLVALAAKVASGPKATLMTLVPRVLPILESGTAQAGAAGTITLASGAAAFDLSGCIVRTTGGTGGAGGSGALNNQARIITAYNTSTKVATIEPNWETNPSSDTTYDILLTEVAVNAVRGRFLRPTVDERTLDVSSGGEAGVDWANVGSPTTTVGLSGTTVKTATDVETDTADIQSRLPAALGANGNIKADVRDYNGVAGTFASGRPEVNTTHAAGTAWGSGAITAAAIATDAIDSDAIAASAVSEIQSGLATAASIAALNNLSAAQVNAEVDTALADARLDELLTSDSDIDGAAPPAVGSVFHELMSKTAGSFTFDQTTDSLEAIRDKAADIETDTGTDIPALIATVQADTDNIQTRLPAALVGGRMDASVGAMAAGVVTAAAIATDAIDADALAADAVAEIQSGLSTLTAAGVRTAVGLASANLDTQLTAIDDLIDTEVAAIKAKTDLIPAAPAAVGDIPTAIENADALLKRDMSAVTGEAARSPLNALRFLRNKWTVIAGTLSVKKEDDTTEAWAGAVTTDATADPITGNDPS